MTDNSFSIGERNFKLSKMNAMKQYHVVRRIAPILSEMLPAMQGMAKADFNTMSEDDKLDATAKIAEPIMRGLSKLSDKDSEMVLFSLLACAEIQQSSGNWAKICNGEILMFQDLELPILLQIAGRAFMFNMAGFFAGLQRTS